MRRLERQGDRRVDSPLEHVFGSLRRWDAAGPGAGPADRGTAGAVRAADRRRLATVRRLAARVAPYYQADGEPVWSLMLLGRQLGPEAFRRRRARAPPNKAVAGGARLLGAAGGGLPCSARSATRSAAAPRAGVPGPRLVHMPSAPSGSQRSPAVSSGRSFAQVAGAILGKQARGQNLIRMRSLQLRYFYSPKCSAPSRPSPPEGTSDTSWW
jgi:hypothetical protein